MSLTIALSNFLLFINPPSWMLQSRTVISGLYMGISPVVESKRPGAPAWQIILD
jgi:hypothetical protein